MDGGIDTKNEKLDSFVRSSFDGKLIARAHEKVCACVRIIKVNFLVEK
jgi:hypothetical protein